MEVEVSDHDHSSPTTSSDEEEEEEEQWDGLTFFDFESDDSIPNVTVKTFLQDCYQHPKILLHKDFQFFRSYLCELGITFDMTENAPFLENHENNTFCVDRGDKWLQKLKERVNPENTQFYWASIIPVKRKADLGLVIFKWEPLPMSIHLLEVYITFCRSKSQIVTETGEVIGHNAENVDDYIEDFMQIYNPTRNIDVEERLNDSKKAIAYRRENNLQPPPRNDLLYLFRRQPKPVANLAPRSSTAASKLKPGAAKRRESTSSSSESDDGNGNESDSSAASNKSSEGSDWADCKGGINKSKSHRKTKKRKFAHREGTKRVNGLIKRSVASHTKQRKKIRLKYEIKIILERCVVPVKSNGTIETASPAPSPTIEDSLEPVVPSTSPETITKPTISTVPNGLLLLKKPSANIEIEETTLPSAVPIPNESITAEGLHTSKETEISSSSVADVDETMEVSSTTDIEQTLTDASCTSSVSNIDSNADKKPMNGVRGPSRYGKHAKKSPNKSTKFPCDICWFGKSFPTQKLLDKHMTTMHSSKKRELITCNCGLRVKKTSFEFHQRFCKTTIVKLSS